jgi:[acyl-carrier-protein] S-malonyltransferase
MENKETSLLESQTKTAYIFSGIDGLDNVQDRLLMLSLPAIKERISQAQKVLDRVAPGFDLTAYIGSPDEVFKREFTLQSIAVSVVQIALFDLFTSNGEKPDYLLGCSLGDVARSYCSGALDFEVIVEASWNYHLKATQIQGCGAYHIKSLTGPINDEMVKEITDSGIYFAVQQTPRHFLVTGTLENLEAWRLKELQNKRYKINPLYDKPLHSPMMSFITEETYKLYSHTLKSNDHWKYKMVSSTFLSVINTRDELLKDMTDNFNSTVYWMQALQHAVNDLGVNRLVNVGPVTTLLLFAERTPLIL